MKYGGKFKPGDRVLFYGLKARVCEYPIEPIYRLWAVPIEIKGSIWVTLAHVDVVSRRGKLR